MHTVLGVFLVFALCLQNELLQDVVIASDNAAANCLDPIQRYIAEEIKQT